MAWWAWLSLVSGVLTVWLLLRADASHTERDDWRG